MDDVNDVFDIIWVISDDIFDEYKPFNIIPASVPTGLWCLRYVWCPIIGISTLDENEYENEYDIIDRLNKDVKKLQQWFILSFSPTFPF